ncbi:MAG TPA: hypothetical protein VL495_02855 [Edaphobacter sp.]|jgi:hypothetical protein|nr:hypothetical protein [Edaphobacter sp.]
MKPVFLRSFPFLLVLAATPFLRCQAFSPSEDANRPLPDIPTLMHEVEEHQRAAEAIQKDYLYHEVVQQQRSDGKKNETREFDVFWLEGVEVHKLTRKDGRDLTPDEQRKESERIDKDVAASKKRKNKAHAAGRESDSRGNDEVTVSRFLELGTFSKPRRLQLNGRETIAIDYAGNPDAKTRNRMESVIHDLSGTLWVDDQDRTITRVVGQFAEPFKVGGGIVMSIDKGTSFSMQQMKINQEVWLPSRIEAQGAARVMLLIHFKGGILITDSDYRKFKATSTILPGISTLKDPATEKTNPSSSPEGMGTPR